MTQEPIDALVIEPDGSARLERVTPTLDNIKALIGGGWLEQVSGDLDGGWIAYGDEEGSLKGMTPNGLAAGLIMSLKAPPVVPVGPVAFIGMRHSGGEDGWVEAPLPKRVLDLMFPGIDPQYRGADGD